MKVHYGINYSKDLVIFNSKGNPYVFDSGFFNNKECLNKLRKMLEDEKIIKSGIGLKEIYKYLKKHGIGLAEYFMII